MTSCVAPRAAGLGGLRQQPAARGNVVGLDGVAARGEQRVQLLFGGRQVVQARRFQPRLVQALAQRASRGDHADAGRGWLRGRLQGLHRGVDNVQDGRRAVRAQRRIPGMGRVAGNDNAGGAGGIQPGNALQHGGQRVFAATGQGHCRSGICGTFQVTVGTCSWSRCAW
jgi:hypothetical protein